MPNEIDFTTLAAVKTALSGSAPMGNADDVYLQQLITAASRFLLKQMNRSTLKIAEYSERFDGNGRNSFTPRFDPVTEISSVQSGSVVLTESQSGSAGYLLSGQRVVLIGTSWELGNQNCVVTYKAGWESVPEDLAQACVELVSMKYRRRKRIGMLSEALPQGAGTASYMKSDVTDDIKAAIGQYSVRF